MALFQNSVLNKYLNELDNSKIATLYAQYSEYFLNPDIQQNIRESKEEQFQEGFLRELKKKKVKLSLSEEAEWMDYFNEKKAEAQELKSKIDATDNEIDHLVYKLYDLTYDEVLIVDPETTISREGYVKR